jgi:nucleoid DNA-binding protein
MVKQIYSKTHKFRCSQIADKLGLSKNMVDRCISEYLNSLEEDLKNGERAVIHGIVSITPLYDTEKNAFTLRARTSSAIAEKVAEIDDYQIKYFDEAIVLE